VTPADPLESASGDDAGFEPPTPPSGKRRRRPEEGALDVAVYDEQADHEVDIVRWRRLAEQVLDAEGLRGDAELSLLFVDERGMSDLNRRFMGEDGPTDVLSFPIDDPIESGRWPDGSSTGPSRDTDDSPLMLGDVVICPAVAARNAPAHAGTYVDEVALLVVHGVLHVLGMDHADAAGEAAMHERERRHLARFHGELPATAWTPSAPARTDSGSVP
jgi:probable rRNA maturation factor